MLRTFAAIFLTLFIGVTCADAQQTSGPQNQVTGVLLAGNVLTVAAPPSGTALVVLMRGASTVSSQSVTNGSSTPFGPFNFTADFLISATGGIATAAVSESVVNLSTGGGGGGTSCPTTGQAAVGGTCTTLAASATTDATNAGNITTGTLSAARLPAIPTTALSGTLQTAQAPAYSGDCTSSAGGLALTCTKSNGVALAASATTDTTNASNITSGTLPAARIPSTITTNIIGNATTSNSSGTAAAFSATPSTCASSLSIGVNVNGNAVCTPTFPSSMVTQGGTAPVGTGDTQTVNNKTLSGSTNTFTNLPAGVMVFPSLTMSGAPGVGNGLWYWNSTVTGSSSSPATYNGINRGGEVYWALNDSNPWPNLGIGATGIANWITLQRTLSAGWDGTRGTIDAYTVITSPPLTTSYGGSQISTNDIPIRCEIVIDSTMGGIVGSHLGYNGTTDCYNGTISSSANQPFPFYQNLIQGVEFDLNTRPWEYIADRYGISVNYGAGTATTASDEIGQYSDTVFKAGTGDNFNSSSFGCLLCTGTISGASPTNYQSTWVSSPLRQLGAFYQPLAYVGLDGRYTAWSQGGSATYNISSITNLSNSLAQVTLATTPSGQVVGSLIVIAGITGSGNCVGYNGGNPTMFVTQQPSANVITFPTGANASGCTATGATATIYNNPGGPLLSTGVAIDPNGNVSGQTLTTSTGGITQSTATVATLTTQAYATYPGGAYFGSASDPTIVIAPPPTNASGTQGTQSVATIGNRFFAAAILMDNGGNSTLGSGLGCLAGDTLTLTGGTGTAATLTINSVNASGGATKVTIATVGAYSVMPGTALPVPVLFTATVGNATSGTLTASVANGTYAATFQEPGGVTEFRVVTVTGGTSVSWTGALNVGTFLGMSIGGNTGTTGGTCTTPPQFALGFGISNLSATPGSGYPCSPPPIAYTTQQHGYSNSINTPARLVTTTSCTTAPVSLNNGAQSLGPMSVIGAALTPSQTFGIVGTTTNNVPNAGSIGELQYVNCEGGGNSNTVTMTIASPAVVTWASVAQYQVSATNPVAWTCPINFTTTGALPTGVAITTTYWIVGPSVSGLNFDITDTAAHALACTSSFASCTGIINTSGTQSGTQTGVMGSVVTTGTWTAGAAMNLQPGDWDCTSLWQAQGATLTTATGYRSAVYGSLATPTTNNFSTVTYASGSTGSPFEMLASPLIQELLASTTTVYGEGFATFGGGSMTAGANLRCRRMR